MGIIVEYLDQPARLLMQALLNCLWQGMIISAGAWLMLRTFRKISATTRSAIWLIALLTIGVLPLIGIRVNQHDRPPRTINTLITEPAHPLATRTNDLMSESAPPQFTRLRKQPLQIPAPEIDASAIRAIIAESANRASPVEPAPALNLQETKRETASEKIGLNRLAETGPLALISLWLIGFSLMMGRILQSFAFLFRLRQRLADLPDSERDRMQRLAEAFGIKRRVRLCTSPLVSMPMTIGALKPLIILPAGFASNLSQSECDSVIAHELAHVKRWDYLTNLLQRIIQASLFFHPAVWLISKQLMIERELACDDWAVKTCEPCRYANCLTKLIEMISENKPIAAAAGILFGKNVISRRVEMILNRDRNATTAVSKSALVYSACIALVFVAVCSVISPVIAVPLGQSREAKERSTKENKTKPPTPPASPARPMIPAEINAIELPHAPAVSSDASTPVAVAVDGPAVIETVPLSPTIADEVGEMVVGRGSGPAVIGASAAQETMVVAPSPAQSPFATTIIRRPGPAPAAMPIPNWGQDDKTRTPVIPETELLNVLTDIVKRDSDPSVRNEALQGIYRMRSDAAINTLIQLYDSVNEVKIKGEIIGYMLRRNGDNTKAIAKLVSIAKNEKDEELRNRAIRALGNVKTEDGAEHLIQIYDSLQDQKMKQYVIRSLAANRSRKAVDKLINIAKNDSDPTIRQYAIRGLYGIDGRLYLELVDKARPGVSQNLFDFKTPDKLFQFNNDFNFNNLNNSKLWQDMQDGWKFKLEENQEKIKELLEKFRFEDLDKFRLELPKIELRLKELEHEIDLGRHPGSLAPLVAQLKSQLSIVDQQLASLATRQGETNEKVARDIATRDAMERQLKKLQSLDERLGVILAKPKRKPTKATTSVSKVSE